jgi:hypothetical protein
MQVRIPAAEFRREPVPPATFLWKNAGIPIGFKPLAYEAPARPFLPGEAFAL